MKIGDKTLSLDKKKNARSLTDRASRASIVITGD